MNMKYEIKPLTEEEETFIEEKINVYADSIAPSEPHTEEEQLVFKVEDEDKNVIGGCVVNIHAWGRAVLAQLWVDGQYRHHGLGSMLIRAAENAAREKNCYYLCLGTADYMARPLYEKHGFHVFTINKDIPMGHVDKGLDEFCEEVVPDKHEYITLSKKLIDADGNLIAAVICGIDEDDTAFVDGIWVEERYRRQGIGSWLFSEIEREAKEKGAYVILSYCCDWVSAFFFQNGFTPRGKLENYPKGHTAYELEKRI